jgi:hypothetical protein
VSPSNFFPSEWGQLQQTTHTRTIFHGRAHQKWLFQYIWLGQSYSIFGSRVWQVLSLELLICLYDVVRWVTLVPFFFVGPPTWNNHFHAFCWVKGIWFLGAEWWQVCSVELCCVWVFQIILVDQHAVVRWVALVSKVQSEKKTLLDRVFNDLGANVSQKQACRRVPLVMRLTINKR